MMNGGPISGKSRRQDNLSLSTFEVEFVAASQAGQEAIYLRETLTDFGYSQTKAILLYGDNLACIAMSQNPVCRKFSRLSHRHQTILCARTCRSWVSQARAFAHTQNCG